MLAPRSATAATGSVDPAAGAFDSGLATHTSRGSARATGTFTVPAASPVYFGFQFRNKALVSGYRAKVSVNTAGAVNVGMSRVADSVETSLASVSTGLTVATGAKIRVQAAVVGRDRKSVV